MHYTYNTHIMQTHAFSGIMNNVKDDSEEDIIL